VWDLGWERSHVVALLAERFPDSDPAAEPAPARRRSLYGLATLPEEEAPPLDTRPTAAFARVADEQGGWTADTASTRRDLPAAPATGPRPVAPSGERSAAPPPPAVPETGRVPALPAARRKAKSPPPVLIIVGAIVIVGLFLLAGIIYTRGR
jgi:hypothetical protein